MLAMKCKHCGHTLVGEFGCRGQAIDDVALVRMEHEVQNIFPGQFFATYRVDAVSAMLALVSVHLPRGIPLPDHAQSHLIFQPLPTVYGPIKPRYASSYSMDSFSVSERQDWRRHEIEIAQRHQFLNVWGKSEPWSPQHAQMQKNRTLPSLS